MRVRSNKEILDDLELGSKECRVCGERKDFINFFQEKRSRDKVGTICKECYNSSHYHGRKRKTLDDFDFNIQTNSKECHVCKERKSAEFFHRAASSRDGLTSRCISCDNKIREEQNSKKKLKLSTKQRINRIKKLYNISELHLSNMMDSRRGCCDICGGSLIVPEDNRGSYTIDHNHSTGEVRGLLCHDCNVMLGRAKDSPSILLAGYNYLINNGYYGERHEV